MSNAQSEIEKEFNDYLVELCKSVGADHEVDWTLVNPRLVLASRYALKQIELKEAYEDAQKLSSVKERADSLLLLLNKVVIVLDPIRFTEFNRRFTGDTDGILKLEQKFPKLGFSGDTGLLTISIISLIATITDMLVDKRLACMVDTDTGIIVGFKWYEG